MTIFVTLAEADRECGGKAEVLGRLTRAGFPVPAAEVLPAERVAESAWEPVLAAVLDGLGGDRFAVRSSSLAEDGSTVSFAGQFHTSLRVRRSHVAREIRRTLASHDHATAYAAAVGAPPPGRPAVIVQRMLTPEVAGVAFTRDPLTGDQVTVIEAVRGLAEPLLSGHASPQTDALTAQQKRQIADLAERVEQFLGGGQDLEWAITRGQAWVLQARPITTKAAARIPPEGSRIGQTMSGLCSMLTGTPASPGTAAGVLRVVRGPGDFARLRSGDVLVCRSTSPSWMPVLARASAVVTEHGGVLSHAAIVARELRIPAVTDAAGATELPDGADATVDGSSGTVQTVEQATVEVAR